MIYAQNNSFCTNGPYGSFTANVSSTKYNSGPTVNLCFRNNSRCPYFLNHDPVFQILDNSHNVVYQSPSILITGNHPYPFFSYFSNWNQKDKNGVQVHEGTYTLKFIDINPSPTATFIISNTNVTDNPYSILNNYDGLPNTSNITINGYMFAPYENVHVTFINQSIYVNANSNGHIMDNSLHIPLMKSGSYPIMHIGSTSLKLISINFFINGYNPSVNPNFSYIQQGQNINLNGNNFAPNDTLSITSSNIKEQLICANIDYLFIMTSANTPIIYFTTLDE